MREWMSWQPFHNAKSIRTSELTVTGGFQAQAEGCCREANLDIAYTIKWGTLPQVPVLLMNYLLIYYYFSTTSINKLLAIASSSLWLILLSEENAHWKTPGVRDWWRIRTHGLWFIFLSLLSHRVAFFPQCIGYVCIEEFISLMHYWLQLCLFILPLGAEVFFPFQLCPTVFFFPAILDPTLSFQKFSSSIMTAVNLWLSDVLELNFLFFAFSLAVLAKDTSKKNHMIFQHMSTVSLFLYKPSFIAPVKC